MLFHTVKAGETVHDIASLYGFSPSKLIDDNGLFPPYRMIPGEVLAIAVPDLFHTVKGGEKAEDLCARYRIDVDGLLCANPVLEGDAHIYPGQVLSVGKRDLPTAALVGFTSACVQPRALRQYLPYLTYLAIEENGTSAAQRTRVAAEARRYGVVPLKEEITADGACVYSFPEILAESPCRLAFTGGKEEGEGMLCETEADAAGLRKNRCFLSLSLGYTADGIKTDAPIPEQWRRTLAHTGEEIRHEEGDAVFTVRYHVGGKALAHQVRYHDAKRKEADLTRWREEGFRGFYIGDLAAFSPQMRCVYASVFRPIKIREDEKTRGRFPE